MCETQVQTVTTCGEINPALVEQIIRFVQINYGFQCDQYENGIMTIEKVAEGYLVSVSDGEGLTILIDADIL